MHGETRPAGALRLLVRTVTIVAVLGALPALAGADAPDAASKPRPNVVVIMTDDQTVETLRVMPNVRRLLARRGATFDNSFVNYALCCPSRATLLTGQYSHNHGVVGNSYVNGLSRLDQTNTLPVWLHRAGYRTALVGKYLNGYGTFGRTAVPPGWDDWHAAVTVGYFDHSMNHNGKLYRYRNGPNDYQTDVYTRLATSVIERHAKAKQPLFLWLSYFAPHHGGPIDADDIAGAKSPSPAPRHRNRFATELLPVTPALNEADVEDKPAPIRRKPLLDAARLDALREAYQQRLESLLAVDEGIAKVVAALRRAGKLDNTLIVFTSDNGYVLGEHRIVEGKEHVYEPSIRVPLIVRGPGIEEGVRLEQPVSNADLAPTIVQLAKAQPSRSFDGRSLVALLADPSVRWARDLLIERGPGSIVEGPRQYTAIRTGRYVYVEYAGTDRELYDLAADPHQIQNLAGDPAAAQLQADLAARLATLRDCAGPACRQSPALQLQLERAQGCVRSATVAGPDAAKVVEVTFVAAGRTVADDAQPPFAQVLTATSVGEAQVRLRAVVALADGRQITLDRLARACPG